MLVATYSNLVLDFCNHTATIDVETITRTKPPSPGNVVKNKPKSSGMEMK